MTTKPRNESFAGKGDSLEIATFYVGDTLMGIAIDQVEEINHHLDLTSVPQGPASVRGLLNLRGEVVTVIDLRVILGLDPTAITRKTCNVVVRWQGEQIGLLADRVGEVVVARRSCLEPPPANVLASDGRFFQGVCKLETGLLLLLRLEQILALEAVSP